MPKSQQRAQPQPGHGAVKREEIFPQEGRQCNNPKTGFTDSFILHFWGYSKVTINLLEKFRNFTFRKKVTIKLLEKLSFTLPTTSGKHVCTL